MFLIAYPTLLSELQPILKFGISLMGQNYFFAKNLPEFKTLLNQLLTLHCIKRTTLLVQQLAHLPPVWQIVGSSLLEVKSVGICSKQASCLRSKNKDWLARNWDNVSKWTFVSLSLNKNLIKQVGLMQSRLHHNHNNHHHHLINMQLVLMIKLKNCSLGIKRQSLIVIC